jgi:hypothetical protein
MTCAKSETEMWPRVTNFESRRTPAAKRRRLLLTLLFRLPLKITGQY